jgi:phosphoadenosine phosphosulfate reductase
LLVSSPRHTPADLAHWAVLREVDQLNARTARFERHVTKSTAWLAGFVREGRCYAGVSWGKDSVVIAGIVAAARLDVPLVWVRVEPIANPDCALVRDRFLERYPAVRYEEIVEHCRRDAVGWHASGTLERGFARTAERFGARYVSGIRSSESGTRKLRMLRFGASTASTCAPIGWWSGAEVFAYLLRERLPVHPAYACSFGGLLDRDRIRVASIGGERGRGHGRREWEEAYYPETVARLVIR